MRASDQYRGRETASIPWNLASRRPGDPPKLVADPTKLKTQLGWEPQYKSIEDTIATAWAWHQKYPDGYTGPKRVSDA